MMLTYANARNPKWGRHNQTLILLEVDWNHVPDETYSPCCIWDANGEAGEEHIADLWNRAMAGDFGTIGDFDVPPTLTIDETLNYFGIREMRNDLLQQSDYAVANDRWHVMSEEDRQAWTDYRQALRDVPQNWTMTSSFNLEEHAYEMPSGYTFPRAPR